MEVLSGKWEDLLAQTSTSSMKSDLGRTHRDTEFVGDRLVRQVVDVSQHDHRTKPRWKIVDRCVERLPERGRLHRLLGIPVGMGFDDIVVEEHLGALAALA